MFKNSYQSGLLSIFYSCGTNPLSIWNMEVHNGHVKRVTDNEVNSIVLEIVSVNVATTYISCPKEPSQVLGIRLPFLVMIVKNLKRYFSFEITILDDKNMRRRFRISNFQSTTKIKPFCTSMPIGLSTGWNQIQFNLADFTRRAYGTTYIETQRVQIHANARIRRIYFADHLYSEEDLPQEYKLFLPLDKSKKVKEPKKEGKAEKVGAAPHVPPLADEPIKDAAPQTETLATPAIEDEEQAEPKAEPVPEAEEAAEATDAEELAEPAEPVEPVEPVEPEEPADEAVDALAEETEGKVAEEDQAQDEPAAAGEEHPEDPGTTEKAAEEAPPAEEKGA